MKHTNKPTLLEEALQEATAKRRCHICQICSTNFTRIDSLNRHMDYIHGDKVESICPKKYTRKSCLGEHVQIVPLFVYFVIVYLEWSNHWAGLDKVLV
jgi:hypothetical protein